jgi:hypothetical protein
MIEQFAIHDFALMVSREHVSSHCFHYGDIEAFFYEIFVIYASLKSKNPFVIYQPHIQVEK